MSETHAFNASYVRETMLDQQPPPVTEVGAIKWVRENLFSSPLNAILTLISLYVVYWVVAHIGPWLVNGIWDAGSLAECREIRNATLGEDASAACFAVISDRWQQLIFGFYPQKGLFEEYRIFGTQGPKKGHDLGAFEAATLHREPYDYLIVPNFVRPEALALRLFRWQ